MNLKLIAMFAPLVVFFIAFGIVVNDLRHPSVTNEHCKVVAVGSEVAAYPGKTLYRQSENPLHDVGLQCEQSGSLLLNDLQLMQTPIKRGQNAEVQHRRFQWLPERWMVSVHTGRQK